MIVAALFRSVSLDHMGVNNRTYPTVLHVFPQRGLFFRSAFLRSLLECCPSLGSLGSLLSKPVLYTKKKVVVYLRAISLLWLLGRRGRGGWGGWRTVACLFWASGRGILWAFMAPHPPLEISISKKSIGQCNETRFLDIRTHPTRSACSAGRLSAWT